MKIVLLTSDAPNQAALASKVAQHFQLAGVVIEKRKSRSKDSFLKRYINAFLDRTLLLELRTSWFGMMEHYKKQFSFPLVETITVASVNSDDTVAFLEKIQPDLIMVSGTGMVKKKILDRKFPKGIINLHTGLSPYIKGGPNCTNWCLALNKFHLIGNTVMWINAGIDSGDLIATEVTPVTGEESLQQLHIKVMEHAHQLYLKCLHVINNNDAVNRVKQDSISKGQTFYTKEWNAFMKWKAIRNFRNFKSVVTSQQFRNEREKLITVS